MTIDPTLLSYSITVLVAVLFIWIIILEVRLKRLLKGSDGKSLEGVIKKLDERSVGLAQKQEEFLTMQRALENKLEKGICSVGFVKFNAFSERGGEQSFAVALLDREGTGVLLSSLYTRDRTNVYLKDITRYHASVKLLPEEREALTQAKEKRDNQQ